MILSGLEIKKRAGSDIIIEPFSERQINPNSYNLKLHDELLVYKDDVLDIKRRNDFEIIKIPREGLKIIPGKLYLGRSLEYTETKNLVPMLEGRSSLGRLGIFIHVTAGFGDVGFKGFWTLEIHCIQPIVIYPFIEVCQIYYHTIEGEYFLYKSNKYQNNKGVQPSLFYQEME
jgi:dCTP deaminase